MRVMEIERLLKWAYVDELPHWKGMSGPEGFRSGWAGMESYTQLLTVIDYNGLGVLPDIASIRLPHNDALIVAEAVESLEGLELCLPEDWSPFDDIAQEARTLGKAAAVRALRAVAVVGEDGRERLRQPVKRLVVHHAIMGDAPDWEGGPFAVHVERNAQGGPAWFRRELRGVGREAREVEVDGYNHKRKRPYPSAYQRFYLEPDAYPVALARAEYELWHAALTFLAEELAGKLSSIRVEPTLHPVRPWETGAFCGRRILLENSRQIA